MSLDQQTANNVIIKDIEREVEAEIALENKESWKIMGRVDEDQLLEDSPGSSFGKASRRYKEM